MFSSAYHRSKEQGGVAGKILTAIIVVAIILIALPTSIKLLPQSSEPKGTLVKALPAIGSIINPDGGTIVPHSVSENEDHTIHATINFPEGQKECNFDLTKKIMTCEGGNPE